MPRPGLWLLCLTLSIIFNAMQCRPIVVFKNSIESDFVRNNILCCVCMADKWMDARRKLPKAKQNTNGATEAWLLTLKRCISRWIGEMQSRRLDVLLNVLFVKMLSFFIYMMHLKRNGMVANLKAQNVAISSVHLAQVELKDTKVCLQAHVCTKF
jgi:hypothetical protein